MPDPRETLVIDYRESENARPDKDGVIVMKAKGGYVATRAFDGVSYWASKPVYAKRNLLKAENKEFRHVR